MLNNNLQQQAMALFKEWFIDTLEASNWTKGTLYDIVESTISGDWGKDTPIGTTTQEVYCIRGADIPEIKMGNKGKMPIRYILPKNFSLKQLVAGDLVVEISGGSPTQSTGRIAIIPQALLDRYESGMVCTNFCKAIKPKVNYSMFLYQYWQYLYDKGVFFSYENGTTGIKNLDLTGVLSSEPLRIPPQNKIVKFNSLCNPIFSQIYANGKQNEELSILRDTLLPKLMSGEIDVSDVEI